MFEKSSQPWQEVYCRLTDDSRTVLAGSLSLACECLSLVVERDSRGWRMRWAARAFATRNEAGLSTSFAAAAAGFSV